MYTRKKLPVCIKEKRGKINFLFAAVAPCSVYLGSIIKQGRKKGVGGRRRNLLGTFGSVCARVGYEWLGVNFADATFFNAVPDTLVVKRPFIVIRVYVWNVYVQPDQSCPGSLFG